MTKKIQEISSSSNRAMMLGDTIKKMNKKYKGDRILANAHHDVRFIVPRVSTELYAMDVATNGGLPLHRVSMAYGEAKGGKTTLFLRGLGNMQKLCGNCYQPGVFSDGKLELPNLETGEVTQVDTHVIQDCPCGNPRDILALWVDAEGVWLPEWAEKMGVWSEKTIVMRPSYGEQGYDVITSFASTGMIDLMVIDSIAAMTPMDELEGGMEEKLVGVGARMNNKFVRKIVSLMNRGFQHNTPMTVWAINQYREKVGGMPGFGPKKVLPGGKGQLFSTSMEIEMNPGKITVDDNGEPLFGEFYWQIKKNKLGPSGGKGSFKQWMTDTDLFVVGDLQEHELVIQRAVDMGLIEHPNNTMYNIGEEKFRGINQLIRYFGEHSDKYNEMKDMMLRRKLNVEVER